MLAVDSFVHVQTPCGRSLGFSALISHTLTKDRYNKRGDMQCFLALTFCNKKDRHFCKAVARAQLREKQQQLVRVRDLPLLLAEARIKALGDEERGGPNKYHVSDYNYILKRFV